jgi:hypothetical protein
MATDSSGSGQGNLKLEPTMIPKLQQAFQSAIDQLQPLSQGGGQNLTMSAPAMADDASKGFQAELNQAATHGAQAIQEYGTRLQGVLTQLGAIQRAYDSNEQQTAADLSRQLES